MANYETLKTAIKQVVKTNGNNEITGALLQQSLLAMINSLGVGYQFIGIATPTTNPGTIDQKVFYIANGKGTYTNFGEISITEDEVVILYYDTAWHKLLTGIASQEKLTELGQEIESINQRFIYEKTYNSLYGEAGYWRVDKVDNIRFVGANGFAVCLAIPIKVGDVISTNSTIIGSDTAGHVLLGDLSISSPAIIQKVILTNGSVEITQAMYNAGARYISLSFNLSDTQNPYVKVERQLSFSDMQNQIDEIAVPRLSIVPIDSSNFNVVVKKGDAKKIVYHFTHYTKTWDSLEYLDGNGNSQVATDVVSADCWDNDAIYDRDGNYIIQGNTNFIFQVAGESKHCGDGHGCEVSLYTQFLADGVEIDPTDSEIACDTFRMIWKTKVYKTAGNGNDVSNNDPALDTNGEPIVTAIHLLDAIINKEGELKINNSLTVKRDNIQFNQLHGAMLEMQYGDFDKVVINTDDKTINSVSSTGVVTAVGGSIDLSSYPNNVANIVEMFGKNVFVRQTIKPVRGIDIDNFVIHSEFYTDRLKNYLMPAGCRHFSPDAGVPIRTFNSGDVISVECVREIEVYSTPN